jgi:hypothetical protein
VRRKGRCGIDEQQALTWLQQKVSDFHESAEPGQHDNSTQLNKCLKPGRDRKWMGVGINGAGQELPDPG